MVPAPERRPTGSVGASLSPRERGQMMRAAALRPLNLLVLAVGAIFSVGAIFFVVTPVWWALPLTLVTYAALVLLGAGDPILQRRVLGREMPETLRARDLSPERRARWLPRGQTREKVDAALAEYRKIVAAIDGSDDVTRAVLEDTVPRLHAAADRIVDVALQREKAAETVRDLRARSGPGARPGSESLQKLEERVGEADAEISATSTELLDLRAKVVRVSIDAGNAQRANDLNASLDELNARLEALGDVASPRD